MRYAKVENKVVTKFIDFNPKDKFSKDLEEKYIECSADTKQNDIYEDGVFTTPLPKIPTQEELNNQITNELNNTNPELIEILEDIVDWAEKEGFTLSEKKKELMNSRKSKRSELK